MRARYLAAGNAGADQSTRLVGIAWRSVNVWMGGAKSITLNALAPLLRRRGTVFVDLQYGDNAADIEVLAAATGATIVHDQTFDQFQDLDAFAAQILALDAVVSISNTTVHMAGAQGVPTAVLLSSAPMWRWGATGETSPWYDSIRLYRQHAPGDWRDPIAAATDFLDRAAAGAL